MAKLTKKSHKRRRIVAGLFMFIAFALISTGFAAWVMSTDSNASLNSNVSVGTVSDAQINFEDIYYTPGHASFYFEPKKNDNTGRVRASDENGANYESLTVSVSGKITNLKYLGEFNVFFDLPEGIEAAVAKNYIVAPVENVIIYSSLTGVNQVKPQGYDWTVTKDEENDVLVFEISIIFEWGSAFNGQNPAEYFDNDPTGLAVSDDDVKNMLNDFYNTVHYKGDDEQGNPTYHESVAYKVIFNAKSN